MKGLTICRTDAEWQHECRKEETNTAREWLRLLDATDDAQGDVYQITFRDFVRWYKLRRHLTHDNVLQSLCVAWSTCRENRAAPTYRMLTMLGWSRWFDEDLKFTEATERNIAESAALEKSLRAAIRRHNLKVLFNWFKEDRK